jgi:hypothetical protein
MVNEQKHADMKRLWQGQVVESASLSLDDLRSRVSTMNKLILTRTFVAGLAFVIFAGFFGALLILRASVPVTGSRAELLQAACVFLIGAGCSFWWLISLVRRVRGKSLAQGEPNACANFYRSELERQRKHYRRSAVWIPLAFSAVWVWGLLAVQPLRVIMIIIWVLFVPTWVYVSIERVRSAQRDLDKVSPGAGQ